MQIEDVNHIGTRVKEKRKQLSLTITEMSKYTGLSSGYLSNIERNMTSPTLSNLKTICEVLGMSVMELIQTETQRRVVVRKQDMYVREYPDQNETVRVIDFGSNEDLYEYVTIFPGERKVTLESKHPYDEIGTILSGSLVVMVEGERYELGKNDSILIPARCLHCTMNEGDEVSESFWHYRRRKKE